MIFVFGSNLDGIHGAGAARCAYLKHDAEMGLGVGPTGSAYALPTKGHGITDMTLDEIEPYVEDFLDYAKENPDQIFALTPVGTGLAGHSKRDIWLLFEKYGVPSNVYLTSTWIND